MGSCGSLPRRMHAILARSGLAAASPSPQHTDFALPSRFSQLTLTSRLQCSNSLLVRDVKEEETEHGDGARGDAMCWKSYVCLFG
jgi:hypothetical protein